MQLFVSSWLHSSNFGHIMRIPTSANPNKQQRAVRLVQPFAFFCAERGTYPALTPKSGARRTRCVVRFFAERNPFVPSTKKVCQTTDFCVTYSSWILPPQLLLPLLKFWYVLLQVVLYVRSRMLSSILKPFRTSPSSSVQSLYCS